LLTNSIHVGWKFLTKLYWRGLLVSKMLLWSTGLKLLGTNSHSQTSCVIFDFRLCCMFANKECSWNLNANFSYLSLWDILAYSSVHECSLPLLLMLFNILGPLSDLLSESDFCNYSFEAFWFTILAIIFFCKYECRVLDPLIMYLWTESILFISPKEFKAWERSCGWLLKIGDFPYLPLSSSF